MSTRIVITEKVGVVEKIHQVIVGEENSLLSERDYETLKELKLRYKTLMQDSVVNINEWKDIYKLLLSELIEIDKLFDKLEINLDLEK